MAQKSFSMPRSTWSFQGFSELGDDEGANNQNNDAMQETFHTHNEFEHDGQYRSPYCGTSSYSFGEDPFTGADHSDLEHNNQQRPSPMEGQRLSMPPSFFDDDDSIDRGDFDRSFPGHKGKAKAKIKSPKQKKSPRRSGSGDLEESPRAKKVKSSLFSGFQQGKKPLFEGSSEFKDETDEDGQPASPSHGIRQSLSSVNINAGDEDDNYGSGPQISHDLPLETSDAGTDYRGNLSPARSDHSCIIPDNVRREITNGPAYDLRTNLNRNVASTWIDQDKTKDYDPEDEARQQKLKKEKAKERKKKSKQAKAPKAKISKFIVRLSFKAFGNVLNICDNQDNWPEGWDEEDSEDERQRAADKAFYRRVTPDREPHVPIEDPAGELDDLTGRPAARGCKSCREFDEQCSMITGGTWPCTQCGEEGVDCDPIIKPKIKGRCNRCKETCHDDEETYCSFEMAGVEEYETCDQCIDAECLDCVAGIPDGYKTRMTDLDEILYGPGREWVNCTNCRANGKRCSLKKMEDTPPCNQCKKAKIGCTFYEVPPKVALPKKGGSKKTKHFEYEEEESLEPDDEAEGAVSEYSLFFSAEDLADLDDEEEVEVVREDTPEFEMEDSEGHWGITTRIKTSFAHPINFNTTLTESSDCNFCEMPTFGFVGHLEKNVHVLRWNNGLGYTELQGGHREDNGPTNMCSDCTIHRLQIIVCPGHDMQQIPSEEPLIDFGVAAELLICAEPKSLSLHRQLQRWCSMCFSLATFKCSTSQPALCVEGENDEMINGCGLRLCSACEENMRETHDGDLDTMATALESEPKAKANDKDMTVAVIRADVGFLRREGLLMGNMQMETDETD